MKASKLQIVRIKIFSTFFFIPIICLSQNTETFDYPPQKKILHVDSIPYTHDYIFKEGIYLKFDNFKQNNPLSKQQIVFNYPDTKVDFLEQVLQQKKITYKDSFGKTNDIAVNEIWGFSIQNVIYKIYNEPQRLSSLVPYTQSPISFAVIKFVGSLCYLVSTQSIGSDFKSNSFGIYYSQDYRYFIYDTQTLQYLDADPEDLKSVLKVKDIVLYKEFNALGYKQRKNSVFLYLKKYNEKHPFYLSKT